MVAVSLPPVEPRILKPDAVIAGGIVPECSGIVMSSSQKNICWAIGDSGNGPWLYRLELSSGKKFSVSLTGKFFLHNQKNHDWEDVALDSKGNIVIADTGNNFSLRKNISLVTVAEPDELDKIYASGKFSFMYPEQYKKIIYGNAFDAEALFIYNDAAYLLTKRRIDNLTGLYRFGKLDDRKMHFPVLTGYLQVDDLVTAADCYPRERLLLFLTYSSIWLLEAPEGDDFLRGRKWWLPVRAGQCEGICFLGRDRFLLCNESGEFFVLRRSSLLPVQ